MSPLVVDDILPGRVFEAKKPTRTGSLFDQLVNDRMVKWVDKLHSQVQYDSPSISTGRRYPIVAMTAFLKWAGRDVTALMPDDEWREWKRNDSKDGDK